MPFPVDFVVACFLSFHEARAAIGLLLEHSLTTAALSIVAASAVWVSLCFVLRVFGKIPTTAWNVFCVAFIYLVSLASLLVAYAAHLQSAGLVDPEVQRYLSNGVWCGMLYAVFTSSLGTLMAAIAFQNAINSGMLVANTWLSYRRRRTPLADLYGTTSRPDAQRTDLCG